MRKSWVFLGLLTGLLFAVGIAKARFAPVYSEVRVTVPFQFHAGDTQLAPGDYIIKRLNEFEPQILTLFPTDGSKTVMMMVHLNDTNVEAKTSEVSFNRYGNQYFLSNITIEGYSNSQQLNRSREEKRVAEGGELRAAVILSARVN